MERPSDHRDEFRRAASSSTERQSRWCELGGGTIDPLVLGRGSIQWRNPDGVHLAGHGVAAQISAAGADRFANTKAAAMETFDRIEYDGPSVARPRAFGGFAFDDLHTDSPPWTGYGAAAFTIPAVQLAHTDAGTWLTTIAETGEAADRSLDRWRARLESASGAPRTERGPGVVSSTPWVDRSAWQSAIEGVLADIENDHLEKVVLAQRLDVELADTLDIAGTLGRLRERYPNCYHFSLGFGDETTFFGSPPERLVEKRGTALRTDALAGSAPRGAASDDDESLAASLAESSKVGREHGLVVDTIRDRLETVSAETSVGERRIKKLANIQHLQTPMSATLETPGHVLDIVEALHPTPAVGGVPRENALATIRTIEPFDRGWFAGPVGWFDGNGDGEFAVAIRSGVVAGRHATLFAGNGIVADSDPDEEYEENRLKFRPLLEAFR